mmetsp:Transcript_1585/g.1926  ORF Transcript_1585/g.1926 Transcript_1585/m.1926 type:complete len:235 (+) Transcript_1585:1329-2033(+)
MMLKKEIVASNVNIKVHLHKALEFRNEPEENLNAERTLLQRNIGNATNESEITFEYRIKSNTDLEKLENFKIEDLEDIPFQTIIEYTKLNGMKCIRTITKILKASDNINEVQENANMGIFAVNAAQQASKLAKKGNFREAQAYTHNRKKFIKNNLKNETDKVVYSKWKGAMNEMYDQLHEQNNMEEALDMQQISKPMDSQMASKKKKKGFFSKLGDKMSKNMQKQKRFNKNSLI